MSWICEISGKPLLQEGTDDKNVNGFNEVVVTPSGHVCYKRLLLSKLLENGGIDPFESSSKISLDESQLTTLKNCASPSSSSSSNSADSNAGLGNGNVVPPNFKASCNFHSMISNVQKEYDNILLELFDTRQQLQETRNELSQSLYQNDASVRVIGRVSQERDTAKQQLQQYKIAEEQQQKRLPEPSQANGSLAEGPSKKKQRVEEGDEQLLPLKNDIPEVDLQDMLQTWEKLHKQRKASKKDSKKVSSADEAKTAITSSSAIDNKTVSLHKASCKGVLSLSHNNSSDQSQGDILLSAGKDKTVVLYDCRAKTIANTISVNKKEKEVRKILFMESTAITSTDQLLIIVLVVQLTSGKEKVLLYQQDGTLVNSWSYITENEEENDQIVNLNVHPSNHHICLGTSKGKIIILRGLQSSEPLEVVSMFSKPLSSDDETEEVYTCGSIHPDGLIYATGTDLGNIYLWDFKSKQLATVLKYPKKNDVASKIKNIVFSNNGYHIATVTERARNNDDSDVNHNDVQVWDLRKQKMIAELNTDSADNESLLLSEVSSLSFDPMGNKYMAFGGSGGMIHVITIKDWDNITKTIRVLKNGKKTKDRVITGLTWNNNYNKNNLDQRQEGTDDENKTDNDWFLASCSDTSRDICFHSIQ